MSILAVCVTAMLLTTSFSNGPILRADDAHVAEKPTYLADAALKKSLNEVITVQWHDLELRDLLVNRLGAERRVSVVIDRRLDPGRAVEFNATGSTLEILDQMLQPMDAGVALVGNTVYVAPKAAVERIRTLIWLRSEEVTSAENRVPAARQRTLRSRRGVAWQEATSPREIIESAIAGTDVSINNIDLVPHDLWAGGEMPHGSAIETLSLVLNQFDLTFEFGDRAAELTLVPIGAIPKLVRMHSFPGKDREKQIVRFRELYPDAEFKLLPNGCEVSARLEVHEALEQLRRGSPKPNNRTADNGKKTSSGKGTNPLDDASDDPFVNQRYRLRLEEVSLGQFLRQFAASTKPQLELSIDEPALKELGVDLRKVVAVKVSDATIDTLLHELLDPLRVTFRRDGIKLQIPDPGDQKTDEVNDKDKGEAGESPQEKRSDP